MLRITSEIRISSTEIEFTAIRAQGAGGQNVNKVSTAIHLRFNIIESSLPEECKHRLLQTKDDRITSEGVIVIKAQCYRSQEKNKADAMQRLVELIQRGIFIPTKRRKTKPSKGSVRKRLDSKTLRGKIKKLRQLPE